MYILFQKAKSHPKPTKKTPETVPIPIPHSPINLMKSSHFPPHPQPPSHHFPYYPLTQPSYSSTPPSPYKPPPSSRPPCPTQPQTSRPSPSQHSNSGLWHPNCPKPGRHGRPRRDTRCLLGRGGRRGGPFRLRGRRGRSGGCAAGRLRGVGSRPLRAWVGARG